MKQQIARVQGASVFFCKEGTWVDFVDAGTAKAALLSLGLVTLSQAYPEIESSERENIFLG